MKSYLITGGAGFIGSNFIYYLMKNHSGIRIVNFDKLTYAGNINNLKFIDLPDRDYNNEYFFVKGDICDRELLERVFETYDVDIVVNFAAESHVDRSINDPGVFVKSNVLGTNMLLEAAKSSWFLRSNFKEGKRFIQVSTDEVYGSLPEEGYFTEKTPLDPHSPYSASKAAADLLVKAYVDTFKFPACITRCSNNYGPYQFPEKLIPLTISNCLNRKRIPVYGNGLNIRDWLYVEDHCRGIDTVVNKGILGETYNFGGHNEKRNIEIVKLIIDYFSDNIDKTIDHELIKYVEDRKGHDKRYAIDANKAKVELGWTPSISFDEGIEMTIKWYLNNQEWLNMILSGDYTNYYKNMYGNVDKG